MGLSVEENVRRCIERFGARVSGQGAAVRARWKLPYRPRPEPPPPEAERSDAAERK
jgi:hypothetical protein